MTREMGYKKKDTGKRNRNGILQNVTHHVLLTESYKLNRPYNSSTKLLATFPQTGVSHAELGELLL